MKKNANIKIKQWLSEATAQNTIRSLEHKFKKRHPVCSKGKYAL